MAPSKPLTFLSAICVLKKTDDITKFFLAVRCPSFRSHPCVHFRHMKLTDSGFYLDGCEHIFHVKPQTNVVCYSIKFENHTCDIYNFPAGMKIDTAIRTFFIAGDYPLVVDHLEIEKFGKIARAFAAEGFRFRVKSLQIPRESFEAFVPLIDPRSFPLEKLTTEIGDPKDVIFDTEICKTAKCLNFEDSNFVLSPNWLQRMLHLPNKTVQVPESHFSIKNLEIIAQNWMENSREIGKRFSIGRENSSFDVKMFSEEFMWLTGIEANEMLYKDKSCLSYQMRDNKELIIYAYESTEFMQGLFEDLSVLDFTGDPPKQQKISMGAFRDLVRKQKDSDEDPDVPKEQLGNFRHHPWVLVMEIVAAGEAKPNE